MRIGISISLIFLSIIAIGQQGIDPAKLPYVRYSPSISGINSQNEISINALFSQGIKVVLADASFKVIQFDVVYDCHSRSLFDFDVKRYQGDMVDGQDQYLRKRVLAGDGMEIANTVIEKNGVRYRMKEFGFLVTN